MGSDWAEMRSWEWGPQSGVIALIKEEETKLAVCEGNSYKVANCKQEEGPHQESGGTVILNSASRTMKNKCLLFTPPSLWYFHTILS